MANRLIRYDTALLRRFLADNFGGFRDLLLLTLVVAIGVAWARQQVLAVPPGAAWFACLAGPAGFAWQRLAWRRLARLAEQSPMAPAALDRSERHAWLAIAHLIVAPPLLAAAVLLGIAAGRPLLAIGLAVAAYGAGASLGPALPALGWRGGAARSHSSVSPLAGGGRAVIALILSRQTLGTRRPLVRAALLLMASFVATIMACWLGRGLPAPLGFAAPLLPSFIILLLTTRLDAGLLGFLPSAGYGPGFIAFAVSGLTLASFLAGTMALWLGGQPLGLIALLALDHAAFALIGIARAWLYPDRTRSSVDLQLQLETAGLIAATILLPPLAIAAAGWRFLQYYRHCAARRWLAA